MLGTPSIVFSNINKIAYYKNHKELQQIELYENTKQWNKYYPALYQYVSNFGIDNFLNQGVAGKTPKYDIANQKKVNEALSRLYDTSQLSDFEKDYFLLGDMSLLWRLARTAHYNGDKQLAKEVYRLILKHFRGNIEEALSRYNNLILYERPLYADLEDYYRLIEKRLLVDTLMSSRKVLTKMGSSINTSADDYGVSIGGKNDQYLIYTSLKAQEAITPSMEMSDAPLPKPVENLYISEKDPQGEWMDAAPLDSINSEYNEGSSFISKDGRSLYFVRCHAPEGKGDCDIYVSKKQRDGSWGKPKNLGSEVNSPLWDSHPALNATEDTLFFSSSRPGGFGGTDLWYSIKDRKGKWSKAQNLGPLINTMKNEVSPYQHSAYDVLYFSSDGHLFNFGGFDIFKVYRQEEQYLEPKNIGPLVNGKGDEFYFAIDAESKLLYFAKSDNPGKPNMDIYSFPLPMGAKPNSTVRFSGRVVEPTTGKVFEGTVTVIDLHEGVEVAPKKIREDGSFDFELIDQRQYLLIVEGDNFFKIEELFYMDGPMEKELEAVDTNRTITFKSIDFESNSADLKPDMENNLHLIIEFLQANPHYHLKVIGHTDSDGSSFNNMRLSEQRAYAIRDYLLAYGNFSSERVLAEGKGDTEPIIANPQTPEDKRINRRVEFKLFTLDSKQ
ncbi:OmpA family protein [Algivirga pacifica]|uniref:OmpA family protein n=1 Tax=Algivirga pacifica TaxID=1162670 RepID=A0ABP9D1S5_9BACT